MTAPSEPSPVDPLPPGASLAQLAATLAPGSVVGFGGIGLDRKPVAAALALAEGGARDLVVVAFLGSIEVEVLLAAGCVAELHTAGVSLDAAGLAPCYRRARQEGTVKVVEWSEGSLHAALDAAGRGLPSLACTTSPRSAVVAGNPHLAVVADPFSGEEVVLARALRPDLALLHVPGADTSGNLFLDGDLGLDDVLARASRRVVATAESVVAQPAREAALSRVWVDEVLLAEGGSWPTACTPLYGADAAALRRWAGAGSEQGIELLRRDAPGGAIPAGAGTGGRR